ncbi:transposase, partial [bacterium]|nr:transposase [bacterium]
AAYVDLLREQCAAYGVGVWGWCLMPNHIHVIVVPRDEDGLRLAIGNTHLRYTRRVNFREGWHGHLWQGRFASYPMDAAHLWQAARTYPDTRPALGPEAANRCLAAPGPFASRKDPTDPDQKVRWRPRQKERDHRANHLGGRGENLRFSLTDTYHRRPPNANYARITI